MSAKRPKVEPIRNPTLFEMDKLEKDGELADSLKVDRPYAGTRTVAWHVGLHGGGLARHNRG